MVEVKSKKHLDLVFMELKKSISSISHSLKGGMVYLGTKVDCVCRMLKT